MYQWLICMLIPSHLCYFVHLHRCALIKILFKYVGNDMYMLLLVTPRQQISGGDDI